MTSMNSNSPDFQLFTILVDIERQLRKIATHLGTLADSVEDQARINRLARKIATDMRDEARSFQRETP